jgi:catechol 2,3-dioxygenase-like lactoylglutathione lyase family enzyme
MNVRNLDHINLTVSNLNETIDWYGKLFGFERVEGGTREGIRWAIIRSGDALLCMYERADLGHPEEGVYSDESLSIDRSHRINHFGLRIVDRDSLEKAILKNKVSVKYGAAIRYPFSWSWYICDPTGHEIEVALWDNDEIKFDGELVNAV